MADERKNQAGFTLIELIVVITIVAILSAVALPRFINAQKDARIAKTNAIMGSMRSAAALAKSRCELDLAQVSVSGSNSVCNSAAGGGVDMDGLTVSTVYAYPIAHVSGILAAAQVNPTSDGLTATAGGTAAGQTLVLDVIGGAAGNCTINYTAATVNGSLSTVVAPVISATTSGC